MNRQNFGKWGINLKPREFAGALASLLQELYKRTPEDILAKLTGVEDFERNDSEVEDEHQIPILLCFDSTYHFKSHNWSGISAEYYYRLWEDFTKALRMEHQQREQERFEKSNNRLRPRNFHLRLELYTNSKDALWLSEQLSQLGDNDISVYLRTDEPTTEIGWNWALKVGFLPDENSRKLREELEQYISNERSWLSPLVELVTLDSENDSCDLLVIQRGLRAALSSALAAGNIKISADCVLIIGQTGEKPEDVPFLIDVFRRLVSTAGIGITYVRPETRTDWFAELIRSLSHDEPIDVALFAACRAVKATNPFLAASRRLIQFSRLAESIKSLGGKLVNLTVDEKISISSEDARSFGIEPGSHHLRKLGDEFLSRVENFRFDLESTSATAVAKIKKEVGKILARGETAKENETRWIQAQIYDLSRRYENEPRVLVRRALRAAAPYEAVVRIGTENADWAKNAQQFSSDLLPSDKESYELTVILTEPQLFEEPQVASIVLPPRGNSSECRFLFYVRENVEKIEARISIVYKNRVLQTALLKAAVASHPSEVSEGNQIQLARETIVRADFSGLKERRHFDAAFILNRDVNDTPRITAIKDRYVSFSEPGGLGDFVKQVDEFITQIADDPQDYAGELNVQATVKLMSILAKQGRMLYKSLAENQDGLSPLANIIIGLSDGDTSSSPANNPKRIQIISAKADTRLPFEFLYDREAPVGEEIVFCPKAIDALERGKCFDDCAGIKDPKSHVCPMGFWGLSKIIERHTHNNIYSSKTVDGDFRFQAEPVKERRHLDVFKKVLFAASDKADVLEVKSSDGKKTELIKGGVQQIISALDGITRSTVQRIVSWEDWCKKITADVPSILVLLTHTETVGGGILALEIEDGSDPKTMRLEMSSIGSEYVCFPKRNFPPPVILLIGCETGKATANIEFMNFVAQFRQSGAAIIVSTGATILGRHAIPVANELLNQLNNFTKQPEASFGEAMRVVKQKMMARGYPMVLTLMTYGDADWQIGTSKT